MEYIDKIRVNNIDYNIAVPGITLDSGGKITSISMPTGSITCSTISATNANLENIETIQAIKLRYSSSVPNQDHVELSCLKDGESSTSIVLQTHVSVGTRTNNFNWRLSANNTGYDITVPNKSGTLALTSDLDNIDLTTAAGTYYRFSPGPIYKSCVYIESNGSLHYAQFTGSSINIPAGAVLLNVKIQS